MENFKKICKMKAVFLDFDGCLNSEIFYQARYRRQLFTFQHWWWVLVRKIKYVLNGFEHKAVSMAGYKPPRNHKTFEYRLKRFKEETDIVRLRWLDSVCHNTGAKIVLSATMRNDFTIEEWNKLFNECLNLEHIKVIGITEHDKEDRIRGYEVQAWLDEHKDEVEDWVALDDDHDFLKTQFSNFFPTDPYCGLTPEICRRIERHFNEQGKYLCGVSLNNNHL